MDRTATVRKQLEACPECLRQKCTHDRERILFRSWHKDHLETGNENGALGPDHLRPRRLGQGRKPGGPKVGGLSMNFHLQVMAIPL